MKPPVIQINSITRLHEMFGLPKPKHPLVSVVQHSKFNIDTVFTDQRFTLNMYFISFKGNQQAVLRYGRNKYDFKEGSMVFIAPNQVFSSSSTDFSETEEEWTIAIHTDFVHSMNLHQSISKYQFFNYEEYESLHLSDNEKQSLTGIIHKIEEEYNQRIDVYTDEIIAINIESLLKYCQRYYGRQFITRKNHNKGILVRFELFLEEYLTTESADNSLPSVAQCGEALHLSPYYLSDLLKAETGKSAKEHIDLAVMNKAKELLLQSSESISNIAYNLGFAYPNYFSKFFKTKTGVSPREFRSLN